MGQQLLYLILHFEIIEHQKSLFEFVSPSRVLERVEGLTPWSVKPVSFLALLPQSTIRPITPVVRPTLERQIWPGAPQILLDRCSKFPLLVPSPSQMLGTPSIDPVELPLEQATGKGSRAAILPHRYLASGRCTWVSTLETSTLTTRSLSPLTHQMWSRSLPESVFLQGFRSGASCSMPFV